MRLAYEHPGGGEPVVTAAHSRSYCRVSRPKSEGDGAGELKTHLSPEDSAG